MKLKGIGQGRHRTNAELEPNFYRMKPVGPGDIIDADVGIANALAVSRQQQQQQQGAPQAASASTLNRVTSLNALNIFGGNSGAATSSIANTLGSSGANIDLNNLYFLTSGGDPSQMDAILLPQSHDESNFQAAQQQSANSSAFFLANLFNANASSSSEMQSPTAFDMSNGSLQYRQTSDAGQLQDVELSTLRNLLQNADSNPHAAQTLMQYMADSNSDSSSQTHGAQTNHPSSAANESSQVSWQNLVAHTGNMDHAMNGNPASLRTGTGSAYGSDVLSNSFGHGGSSARRMSTAAMSSLLSSQMSTSTESAAARYAATVTSPNLGSVEAPNNANLLFLSSLQDPQRSESANNLLQLLDSANSTDPPGFTGNQLITRMTDSSTIQNHGQFGLHGAATGRGAAYQPHYQAPVPVPATQQYAILGSANAGGSGSSFSDLHAMPNPTFLDSVYEPIPIKNGTGDDAHQKPAERTSPSGSVNSQSLI